MGEGMDQPYKFLLMENTILDFSSKIYFQEKVFIFGIVDNIILAIFSQGKKYGDALKEKFNIKEGSKTISVMVKAHVGTQQDKYILVNG